jgi:glycosyltransferase involved in cell wall biosynthesis
MVIPLFSVVIATYDRGPLIEATLSSVARQTIDDIEVLVVSDGPAASGLAATVARFGERFHLVEIAVRCGSQFAPNNHAWSISTGRFVAYLGHDDIWLPGHLAALRDTFEQHPQADFAASGCLYFGPPGSGGGHTWVTGLFDPDDRWMAHTHFFPPSSVAHRRHLPHEIRWPDADVTRRPVDSEFMLTAALHGCVFTSTRTITVLKFNSALRYLSYLSPDDDEQRRALALIEDPARLDATIQTALADAASSGNYMTTLHPREFDGEPGEAVRIHARIRGIDTPPVKILDGPTWMPLDDDPCAFDWHGLERQADHSWRWSGPNPRPRLLIPFTHNGPVRVSLHIARFATDDISDSLAVLVDRRPTPTEIQQDPNTGRTVIEIDTMLRSDRPSVVELRMNRTVPPTEFDPGSTDTRRMGLSLTGIHLEPARQE